MAQKVTPYQIKPTIGFVAYSASGTIQTLTTDATIQYEATEFNVGGHYDTTTYIFTAPVDGLYWFEHNLRADAVGADENLIALLTVDDVLKRNNYVYSDSADTGSDPCSVVTGLLLLSAGDEVKAKGSRTGTGAVIGGTVLQSRFSGYLIGRT